MIEMIKKNKAVIAVAVTAMLVLTMIFVLEGRDTPSSVPVNISTEKPKKTEAPEPTLYATETSAPSTTPSVTVKPEETAKPEKTVETDKTAIYAVENEAEEYSLGEETITYTSQSDNKAQQCTIAIYCNVLLENKSLLDRKKHSLIPENGCILSEVTVEINEGDSVFDVLKKATKDNKIHMEFVNTPIYNSAYVEGINNIYEFDGGELSGWMYSVNGEFPNRGSSGYKVKTGDKIEWHYTCDLGRDVSGRIVNQRDE